jgi:hypothetical protein
MAIALIRSGSSSGEGDSMRLGKFGGLSKNVVTLFHCDEVGFDQDIWSVDDEVTLINEGVLFFLVQRGNSVAVKPTSDVENLCFKLSQGLVIWALRLLKNGQYRIQGVDVSDVPTQLNMDIGVSARDAEALFTRSDITTENVEAASAWLNDEFILLGEGASRVFVSVYAGSADGTLEIRGQQWVATISEVDGFWSLSNLTRTRRSSASLRILSGNIRFIDASVAAQLTSLSYKHALKETIGSHGSYIQLWTQYSDMEWATKLEDARHLGAIRFRGYEKGDKPKEWLFHVRSKVCSVFFEKYQKIVSVDGSGKNDVTLEVMTAEPEWLDNSLNVEDSGLTAATGRPWLCNLVSCKGDLITLQFKDDRDQPPPFSKSIDGDGNEVKKGVICLSMHGDKKSRERRIHAVNSIQQRSNPMPQLHYLLEGIDVPFAELRTIPPLSPAAKAQFKGEPTRKQKEALKVALNTPDIAIIIGPPGTGKTQVITALQTRLAQELKDLPMQHQMLVSSYQHDAVDNVIARSSVFGLPAVKVGGKSNKKGAEGGDPITLWCNQKAAFLQKALSEKIAEYPELTEIQKALGQIAVLRVSKPDSRIHKEHLTNINYSLDLLSKEYQINIKPGLEQRWRQWCDSQNASQQTSIILDDKQLLRHIRALRVSANSFSDDGAIQCMRLLDYFNRQNYVLAKFDEDLLDSFSRLTSLDQRQLTLSNDLQKRLLDGAQPDYRPKHVQKVLSEEECTLLDDIHDDLETCIKTSRTLGYIDVLGDYLSALEYSPQSIKSAAEIYTSVLGATCQQAASSPMMSIKNVEASNSINFNSVIVDEAARANPLDLLIPMSMGRRRIILVGDHRQLPHLLEPKVEEQLAEKFELEQTQREMLKISLFQRLKESLQLLEDKPGQPKRVVMLDTQFRMHPLLGDFVSKQFYESEGLAAVKSGLSEEFFFHDVPGYADKVCAWKNIPVSMGVSTRKDGSLQREAEATFIGKEAKKILNHCPDLSVGIITFYRAQVDTILESLLTEGLAERREGKLQIAGQYRYTRSENGEERERLRVGTVDAFQGKEFDVVLLSMVRTMSARIDIDDEDSLNRGYGFLRLDNRLNVAMSRQQRLLIMVGDSSMATHPAAHLAAPSIPAFYSFCQESYGTVF